MKIHDDYEDLKDNFLAQEPSLAVISDPFVRFYEYRRTTGQDVDRSDATKDIYKKLGWYDENTDREQLEPDTFFASSHNLTRKLFRKHDTHFYVEHFKDFCLSKEIDYFGLPDDHPIILSARYHWMTTSEPMLHYDFIINHSSFQAYIVATHKIGNFLILPKNFGWKPKVTSFKECPIKSLRFLQKNWSDYAALYKDMSLEEWKKPYALGDCYENNKLRDSLMIDYQSPFESILNTLGQHRTNRARCPRASFRAENASKSLGIALLFLCFCPFPARKSIPHPHALLCAVLP